MAQTYSQKAPFNDWWYWSECLVKRFNTIAEIYKENGEMERSNEIAEIAHKLKINCMTPVMAARKGMETDEQKEEIRRLEEEAIVNAVEMFRKILTDFPFISNAIQDFLYVYWEDVKWEEETEDNIDEITGLPKKPAKKSASDQRITELFWGPIERQDEGIRSGKVEDGGLPGLLYNLMVAEKTASSRTPTDFGQLMQASAVQSYVATTAQANQKWENAGVQMNFKPGGGM